MDEGDVQEPDDAQDGPESGAFQGVIAVAFEHHVGHEDQPEDQGEGQLRIPDPPGAPDRFGPQGPREQDQGAEEEADLGGAGGPDVPAFVFAPEVEDAEEEDEREAGIHRKGRGHVEVHNFLGQAHLFFHTGVDQGHVGGDEHADEGQDAQSRGPEVGAFLHLYLFLHHVVKQEQTGRDEEDRKCSAEFEPVCDCREGLARQHGPKGFDSCEEDGDEYGEGEHGQERLFEPGVDGHGGKEGAHGRESNRAPGRAAAGAGAGAPRRRC